MNAAFGWLALLYALFNCGPRRRPWTETWPETAPPAPAPPALPAGGVTNASNPAAPWPQVVPTDLPKFPGSQWEFDEPPPAGVRARARALVDPLWKRGSGSFQVERTDARWIAYRAEVVASGKRGVVAYRIKRPAAAAPPRAVAPRPAAPRPATPAPAPRPPSSPPAAAAPRPQVSPLTLRTLRIGMGLRPAAPDPDVRMLQERLGISADGRFGDGTKAAVVKFQLAKGLVPDGVVGANTWAALFAVRS